MTASLGNGPRLRLTARKRIGVAVGETSTASPIPLGAIEAEANDARFAAIDRYVNEWHPVGLRGRPAAPLGRLGARGGEARRQVRAAPRGTLQAATVVLVDETLTSATAESQLRETRTRAARKGDVDALAAAIILQSFLDQPEGHERLAP